MPNPPLPLPKGLGVAFSVAEALREGASPARLRALDLDAPFRGVRITAARPLDHADQQDEEDPGWRDRAERRRIERLARGYAQIMEAHAFFAGRTAAVLHGLPVAHGRELDIAVRAPRRAPRRRGVRGRKIKPRLVRVQNRDGLMLASPASAWAMLGMECTIRDLVVIGDAIARIPRDRTGTPRPEHAHGTIGQLRAAVDAGPRPGRARLRAALDEIVVGSSSPLETEFRLDAAESPLPAPALDVEIRDAEGRLLGISEFAFAEYRLVVEVEGDHHRTSRTQWNRDIQKYNAYAAEGWEVIRLTSSHIRSTPSRAVAMVADALRGRGWHP
ncbi:hypothetical protein J2Y69_000852 [Microbacterium resistens]|uniref:DUF559 domain-containing protein n=1 Tax=Microbacterium resistens TaxID=156977 RepID=A0ABU1S9H6_9MICO|nr:DUF559 domain-containing protein [Microbacterium resistens]MDR6866260.1 hypothetical protein [Microbacterium resistens]